LTLTAIDLQSDRKVAELIVWRSVIAERRPALGNGFLENLPDLCCEISEAPDGGPVARARGADASPPQSFGRIDIADPNDQALIHQQRFDARPPGSKKRW
jgi:hypothetical protein